MDWKQALKDKHLRVTQTRLAVLELLSKSDRPLDIQAILGQLAKADIRCDLVTVYRMMESFRVNGLTKQVNFEDGKYRYEIEGEHHHHLICEKCGRIQEIHDLCILIKEDEVKRRYSFLITRHQLEFFGLCKTCIN